MNDFLWFQTDWKKKKIWSCKQQDLKCENQSVNREVNIENNNLLKTKKKSQNVIKVIFNLKKAFPIPFLNFVFIDIFFQI